MSYSYFLVGSLLAILMAGPAFSDECYECHKSPEFKVTNKKIYDYNIDFEVSIHGIAELACTDCHGGDSSTKDKKQAHKGVMDPVCYDNIPATCGECHDEQFDAFTSSNHYQLLEKDGNAPNCVTCHGAMDVIF